ncbi:MAG: sulfotransferase family protein [Gammaproteobacteria bacterium]|nr:sulfotransferase family protein [Gammaproteobacteria bacterium]
MIVSHKHRFIFFAVPKTGTHAIREALRPHLHEDDWEQQVLFGQQALPIPEIARLRHGHISVQQIRPHFDADRWTGYFKFGFVRNPFDRFVSICFFLQRDNSDFAHSARRFMKLAINRQRFRQRVLALPQYRLLTDADARVGLDFVGRYESLQESYDKICAFLGIPSTPLPRKNPSKHKPWREYYDEELAASVRDFYEMDLRLFGYDDLSGSTK